MILSADGATLTLSNQKNGWQNVSIHHEWSGEDLKDAVRSIGRCFCHIRQHMDNNWETFLSAVFTEEGRCDVTDKHVTEALKAAAGSLQYPELRGIPLQGAHQHSFSTSWRRQCPCPLGLQRNANTKDGQVAWRHIQNIHPRTARKLFGGHVTRNEEIIWFRQCGGRSTPRHHHHGYWPSLQRRRLRRRSSSIDHNHPHRLSEFSFLRQL